MTHPTGTSPLLRAVFACEEMHERGLGPNLSRLYIFTGGRVAIEWQHLFTPTKNRLTQASPQHCCQTAYACLVYKRVLVPTVVGASRVGQVFADCSNPSPALTRHCELCLYIVGRGTRFQPVHEARHNEVGMYYTYPTKKGCQKRGSV